MLSKIIEDALAFCTRIEGYPDGPGATAEVKAHVARLPALVPKMRETRDETLAFARESEAATGALLLRASTGEGLDAGSLRAGLAPIIARSEAIQAKGAQILAEITRVRDDAAADNGRLQQECEAYRARRVGLEAERSHYRRQQEEMKNRSTWTWLFLPAKAIDEFVSLCQHGKSTEAALADANRELARVGEEERRLRGLEQVTSSLNETVSQVVNSSQLLNTNLHFLQGYMNNEEKFAAVATPEDAKLYLNALPVMFRAIAQGVE